MRNSPFPWLSILDRNAILVIQNCGYQAPVCVYMYNINTYLYVFHGLFIDVYLYHLYVKQLKLFNLKLLCSLCVYFFIVLRVRVTLLPCLS